MLGSLSLGRELGLGAVDLPSGSHKATIALSCFACNSMQGKHGDGDPAALP